MHRASTRLHYFVVRVPVVALQPLAGGVVELLTTPASAPVLSRPGHPTPHRTPHVKTKTRHGAGVQIDGQQVFL